MHLCAGLTAESRIMEPLGEIGANFSLQLSSLTHFAKISKKKLLPKINVKNIKTRVWSSRATALLTWIHCVDEKRVNLISWLHQKPADLNLHCFQKRVYFEKVMHTIVVHFGHGNFGHKGFGQDIFAIDEMYEHHAHTQASINFIGTYILDYRLL